MLKGSVSSFLPSPKKERKGKEKDPALCVSKIFIMNSEGSSFWTFSPCCVQKEPIKGKCWVRAHLDLGFRADLNIHYCSGFWFPKIKVGIFSRKMIFFSLNLDCVCKCVMCCLCSDGFLCMDPSHRTVLRTLVTQGWIQTHSFACWQFLAPKSHPITFNCAFKLHFLRGKQFGPTFVVVFLFAGLKLCS